ncbi:MAG: OmpA family protein [Acidobacteriota bacterium]
MKHNPSIRRSTLALIIASVTVFSGVPSAEAGLGKLWPFASKKHVKQQIDPVSGRVSELEEVNKQHEAMIKDVDQRAQEGIKQAMATAEQADAKAMQADRKAVDAGTEAQKANTSAVAAESRLATRLSNVENYQLVKTLEVVFKSGQFSLDQESQTLLDELAGELSDSKGYILQIQGFTDPSGSEQVNLELSRKRADSVVRYLADQHEIPLFRMRTLGMGEAKAKQDDEGRVSRRLSRRVEISVLRNDAPVVAAHAQPRL